MKKHIALVIAALMVVSPALAKNQNNGPGNGNGHDKGDNKNFHLDFWNKHDDDRDRGHDRDDDRKHSERHDDNINVVIDVRDQQIIRSYYEHDRVKRCPPGLKKKNPDCMPPGQYKKYHRGEFMPDSIVWYSLPPDLIGQLHPAPGGTRYVVVDQNVYLVSEATRKILDAVVLLSAVR